MPIYHCHECGRLTEHLNVARTAQRAGVSRGTAYRWIRRALVHSLVHPSGRIFVCSASLLVPGFSFFPGERAAAVPWAVAGGAANAPTAISSATAQAEPRAVAVGSPQGA